ncbi:MAG: siderophore-interacting protein [Phycisphaerales bacterium JB063]
MPTNKPKRTPRPLTVLRTAALGRHLRRITLGGPGLDGFPEESAGSYIKLLLPKPSDASTGMDEGEYFIRTYTVRHHRPEAHELDIDVVLHSHAESQPGPGAVWANNAAPGDPIAISGPGNATFADPTADWFLFAGDLSAYPAICANIERLPQDVRGVAIIETPDPLTDLPKREHLSVQWVAPVDRHKESALVSAVRAVPWQAGRGYVWAAAEFDQMKALRRYFKKECGLGSQDLYISSYWKQGLREEDHKQVKREDAQANPE